MCLSSHLIDSVGRVYWYCLTYQGKRFFVYPNPTRFYEQFHGKILNPSFQSGQKHLGIRIYPITSLEDENATGKVADMGKTIKEYVSLLRSTRGIDSLGEGGGAYIRTKDVYNMYNMETEIIW